MNQKRTTYIHLISLFVTAVILRLLYLKLASDSLGFEQFAHYAPDSNLYLAIGDHILSWHRLGSYGLLRVGPGFGLILATIKFMFGSNLIWPILFNIVMGGLAPVFVYLLAYQLFNSRSIALLSGGFSAVSLTSIALSCHILTDQPFFTLQAATLVLFVRGYQTGRIRWYALAGLIAGFGAYVRPSGQIWPLIFIFLVFVVPLTKIYRSRLDFVRRAGITGAVMLLMVLGWSARNYAIHDLFIFGTNGMLTVRSCLVSQTANKYWGEDIAVIEYRNEWEEIDGDTTAQFVAAYGKAKARVVSEFKARPFEMIRLFFHNVEVNAITNNYFVGRQIPALAGFMNVLNAIVRHGVGHLLLILTPLGLILMAIRRQRFAAWLLGVTYLSFTGLMGASMWQGSRLHYTAEMAWAIVIAWLAVETVNRLRSLWSRRFTQASPDPR